MSSGLMGHLARIQTSDHDIADIISSSGFSSETTTALFALRKLYICTENSAST